MQQHAEHTTSGGPLHDGEVVAELRDDAEIMLGGQLQQQNVRVLYLNDLGMIGRSLGFLTTRAPKVS